MLKLSEHFKQNREISTCLKMNTQLDLDSTRQADSSFSFSQSFESFSFVEYFKPIGFFLYWFGTLNPHNLRCL